MANKWNLTTNIGVPNVRNFSVVKVKDIDEDNNRMVLEIAVAGLSTLYPFRTVATPTWKIVITNGSADGIAANPGTVTTTLDMVIKISLVAPGTGIATAFSTLLAAYVNPANAADKRGALLTAMAGITGTVVGGPLDGTTQPIIPPGALV